MRSLRTVILLTATAALVGSALVTTSMASATPVQASAPAVPAAVATSGSFTSVAPSRILDTRLTHHPFAGGIPENLQISGKGGVPATGVSSVVFNLTVTGGTATRAYVTAYPRGATRPTASNINFARGWTGANLVTVKLGTSGQITLYLSAGHVNLLVDVVGWYSDGTASPAVSGQFQEVEATRLVDTRTSGSIEGRGRLTDPMTFTLGATVADPKVKAVAVNLTVVHPKDSGYLTAWSGVGNPPTASVLNFRAGKTVANLAVVPVSPCTQCTGASHNLPSITVLNGSDADTDLLIDIWGFYDDGTLTPQGLFYKALPAPVRIVDTRISQGTTTLGTATTRTVTAPGTVSDAGTQLLVQNVTALPQTNTYVTLWRAGDARPTVSNLDPLAGATVATLALTAVNGSNQFSIYNNSFTTNILVDVAGSFETTAPAIAQNAARSSAARPAVEKWSVASAPLFQH